MAGRGTDILLGGNYEAMAKDALAEEKPSSSRKPRAKPAEGETTTAAVSRLEPARLRRGQALKELLEKFKAQCEAEREEVLAAGGLKIVGTERHESRRIDNQLRGRAGRQGDPGSSRFYLSLQDDLLRIFGLDKMTGLMERLGLEEDVPIESPMVTKSIENAQKKVEGQNFDQRKNVLEYDDVMNQQRKTIYALRRQVLDGRYHPEPTEDEEKAGIVPEPVTESGDWTVEALTPRCPQARHVMIQELKTKVAGARRRDRARRRRQRHPPGLAHPARRAVALLQHAGRRREAVGRPRGRADRAVHEGGRRVADPAARAALRPAHTRMAAVIDEVLDPDKIEDDWDWDQLEDALKEQFNLDIEIDPGTPDEAAHQIGRRSKRDSRSARKSSAATGSSYFQRHFMLDEVDQQWIEHLKMMDALREGIGLQGYGQLDPKQEYKKAGFSLFNEMMNRIQENATNKVFRVIPQTQAAKAIPVIAETEREMIEQGVADKSDDEAAEQAAAPRRSGKARTAGEGATTAPVKRDRPKVGRNIRVRADRARSTRSATARMKKPRRRASDATRYAII